MDNNPTHHQCIICIGSNYHKRENLAFARHKLSELFTSICFAPEQETKPLYFKNQTLFSNQVAVFFSDKREEEVINILKEIEVLPEDNREIKKTKKYVSILTCFYMITEF